MKLWRLQGLDYLHFASIKINSAWLLTENGLPDRERPLVIEWEPEVVSIGDFTWSFGSSEYIIVKQEVGEILRKRYGGIELRPIEMFQNPKLKHPKRMTRRTKPRIWLPYEGPPLCELFVTAWVEADIQRSTITAVGKHPNYDIMRYKIEGDERIDTHYDMNTKQLIKTRIPREPGKGIYIAVNALKKIDIFRVTQLPGWTFCKDTVRQFILDNKFTNIDFLEMGETF